jgi:hypothetical protein
MLYRTSPKGQGERVSGGRVREEGGAQHFLKRRELPQTVRQRSGQLVAAEPPVTPPQDTRVGLVTLLVTEQMRGGGG